MLSSDWQVFIVAATPGVLGTVAGIIAAINAHYARIHAREDLKETTAARGQIATLEVNINHRLSELVSTAEAAGRAEGRAQGIAEEQAKQAIKDKARAEVIGEERRAAVTEENKP